MTKPTYDDLVEQQKRVNQSLQKAVTAQVRGTETPEELAMLWGFNQGHQTRLFELFHQTQTDPTRDRLHTLLTERIALWTRIESDLDDEITTTMPHADPLTLEALYDRRTEARASASEALLILLELNNPTTTPEGARR